MWLLGRGDADACTAMQAMIIWMVADGSDVLSGGAGDDVLVGGAGDELAGGDGNDTMFTLLAVCIGFPKPMATNTLVFAEGIGLLI